MTATPAPSAGSLPRAIHQESIRRYSAEREPYATRSRLLSRLRLLTFLPGLALLILALSRGPFAPLLAASVTLFLIFAVLVVRHARVEAQISWLDALRLVNERGVARIDRAWDRLPPADPPPGVVVDGHPYAADLDLFGRASLYQLLGPAATAPGARRLAEWLLAASPQDEVRQRQDAVAALTPLTEWREHFAAHGVAASRARFDDVERFLAWAEGEPFLGRHGGLVRATVLALTAAIWILSALYVANVTASAFWMVPAAIGIVLSFVLAGRVGSWLDRAGAGQSALGRYGQLLEHAVRVPPSAPRLAALHSRLTAEGRQAPVCMGRLQRILGFGELRHSAGIMHFPIQALTLWDFHVVFALERWRIQVGRSRARVGRGARGARRDDGAGRRSAPTTRSGAGRCSRRRRSSTAPRSGIRCWPTTGGSAMMSASARQGTLLLVTGSNMSGKSTLLRSIGLNIVLAQAGSVVAADRLSLPLCDLQTSLRVQDSLELGPLVLHGRARAAEGSRGRRRARTSGPRAGLPARRDPAGHEQRRARASPYAPSHGTC